MRSKARPKNTIQLLGLNVKILPRESYTYSVKREQTITHFCNSYLEQICCNRGQASSVIRYTIEIFVVGQNRTEDVQEKLQRELVEEVNLNSRTDNRWSAQKSLK